MTLGNRMKIAWTVLGIAFVVLVVVVTSVVLTAALKTDQISDQQQANSPKLDRTEETLRLVKDCVTPGGVCYQRGQDATAEAVGSIAESQIAAASFAASCAARGLVNADEIYACVLVEFKNREQHPTRR